MDSKYVLPNLIEYNQGGRGSIKNRFEELQKLSVNMRSDFKVIEIPGDFIKNITEVTNSQLPLGAPIISNSVSTIYDPSNGIKFPYCLHTEPELRRTTSIGSTTAKLKWFDTGWREQFFTHIVSICDYLGDKPEYIEIHPGSRQERQNSIEFIVRGIIELQDSLRDYYGQSPQLILENRTTHVISSGFDIRQFWFQVEQSGLAQDSIGVILDIQQLFTDSKKKNYSLKDSICSVPPESIKGFHIHQKHGIPKLEGPIDWSTVRQYINSHLNDTTQLILPEVHRHNQFLETYKFCKSFLDLK